MSEWTKERIAELRELDRHAAPPPWKADTVEHIGENWLLGSVLDLGQAETPDGQGYSQWIVTTDCIRASEMNGTAEQDAKMIAAARNALPAALDEIERLRARVAELREAVMAGGRIAATIGESVDQYAARDQRREQLLRECLPEVEYARGATPSGRHIRTCADLAARIRPELGE